MISNTKNQDNKTNLLNTYFLVLFSIIPVSILLGPAISLINILLIVLTFLIIFYKQKNFILLKDQTILLLIILYIYFIFNSLISIDIEIGAMRNFGFIRYIVLFLAINYFFSIKGNLNKVLSVWLSIFLIVLFDVIFEFSLGYNILGFESENKKRIVSFFKDELIVGSFLNGVSFILIGYLFTNYEKKKNYQKVLVYIFLILVAGSMIFTGERSNTIKLLIGLTIFFSLNNKIKLKYKVFFIVSVISIFSVVYNNSSEIRHRYDNDLVNRLTNEDLRKEYIYFRIYNSGFEVFKKYPLLGVGNKNYRLETCRVQSNEKYLCFTHPHNIYLEFLSEHGIVGTLILLSIFFYLFFKNLKIMLLSRNLIQIGCFSFLLTQFFPILPGGSFFTDFNATFFWINLSIFYASNLDTNIWKKYSALN